MPKKHEFLLTLCDRVDDSNDPVKSCFDLAECTDDIRALVQRVAALEEALQTIVIHKSDVQMDPQWAVQVARNALGPDHVHGPRR